VTIDEILKIVDISLGGQSLSGCMAADANHDGAVTVDEILTAINKSLNGCPATP
jgi:hypothetical protein